MKLRSFLLAMMLCVLCVTQASALEYDFDAPEDYLFGQPTSSSQALYPSLHPADEAHSFRCSSSSDCNRYAGLQSEWENPNVDRSKNTALIAPGFGTPTSYLPGSGEYLTPNFVPGAFSGGLVNQVGSAGANATGDLAGGSTITGGYPSVDTSGNFTVTQIPSSPTDIAQGSTSSGYTEVTDDLYYADGSLGTLKIPAIGLTVKVYQGTDSAALKKGAGHFANTSIWDGNACFAGHNRGVNNHFGKIHNYETEESSMKNKKIISLLLAGAMTAAQTCSDKLYSYHHNREECETVATSGYPNGFGSNIKAFTGTATADIAQQAVNNWINSPGHRDTMLDPDCDCLGVGVTESDKGVTYCYLFTGKPDTINPYG